MRSYLAKRLDINREFEGGGVQFFLSSIDSYLVNHAQRLRADDAIRRPTTFILEKDLFYKPQRKKQLLDPLNNSYTFYPQP